MSRIVAMFLFLGGMELSGQDLTRDEVLRRLQEEPLQVAVSSEQDPYASVLQALDRMAMAQPDEELTRGALLFQLRRPGADFPLNAQILGRLFLEQTDTFLKVWRGLPGAQQLGLAAYLRYGWQKAMEGKNKSSPRLVEKQKKMDRLLAALINTRP
jgi:hypothetical protein